MNILITGASRGIGKAIAEELLTDNNIGINCSISTNEMYDFINKTGRGNISGFVADVSQYDQVEKMFMDFKEKFGEVDVLINNAGVSYYGLFNEMQPSEWETIIDVNLKSVFNCSHLAVSSMIKRHCGCIINISSIWGISGASCEAVYSASKGAVNLFTKSLAKELGPSGIRVNGIACGVIDTQMNDIFTDEEKNKIIDDIPMMRMGKPNEIAGLVRYLISDKSKYLTGQIITIDGGYL